MTWSTQWTWVWSSSGSWWWTGKPGLLQSMGLQRVRHDWVTELTKWLNIAKRRIRMLYIKHVDVSVMIKKKLQNLKYKCKLHFFFNFDQIVICCCCPVTESCLTLYNTMDGSTADFSVIHHLLELVQTHVPWVSDTIQLSHLLSTPSSLVFNLCHNQGIF